MRYLIALAALVGALAATAAAPAGGWATVELESLPAGISKGGTWNARLTVLRHGVTPTEGAAPMITISGPKGAAETFAAKPTGKTGVYAAAVVFPSAGTWNLEISDGLAATGYGVSTTTTYPLVTIDEAPGGGGGGSDELPALPLAGLAFVLVLAGAAAAVAIVRRARRLTPAGR